MKTTLSQMYAHLNRELFDEQISLPTIEFSLNRPFALRWENKANILHIGRAIIRCNFEEVAGHLVHEMIHMYNSMRGIEDLARNQYHNKQFMETAVSFGLYVQQHKRHGWSVTTIHRPSSQTSVFAPDAGSSAKLAKAMWKTSDEVPSYKSDIVILCELIKQSKPAKCFFLKYCCQCPPPFNSIRSGRRPDSKNALDVWCNKCGQPFQYT